MPWLLGDFFAPSHRTKVLLLAQKKGCIKLIEHYIASLPKVFLASFFTSLEHACFTHKLSATCSTA